MFYVPHCRDKLAIQSIVGSFDAIQAGLPYRKNTPVQSSQQLSIHIGCGRRDMPELGCIEGDNMNISTGDQPWTVPSTRKEICECQR